MIYDEKERQKGEKGRNLQFNFFFPLTEPAGPLAELLILRRTPVFLPRPFALLLLLLLFPINNQFPWALMGLCCFGGLAHRPWPHNRARRQKPKETGMKHRVPVPLRVVTLERRRIQGGEGGGGGAFRHVCVLGVRIFIARVDLNHRSRENS